MLCRRARFLDHGADSDNNLKSQLDAARFTAVAVAPAGSMAQSAPGDSATRLGLRGRSHFHQFGHGCGKVEITIAIRAGASESEESACCWIQ